MSTSNRRQVLTGGAIAVGGLAWPHGPAWAATAAEISRAAESIHQEPTFTATRQRVYEALTDTRKFDQVTQASGVMKELSQRPEPTQISPHEGGRFDHTGFPTGNAEHLAAGWHAHYWMPLEKILAAG
jgi:hypothetical protein